MSKNFITINTNYTSTFVRTDFIENDAIYKNIKNFDIPKNIIPTYYYISKKSNKHQNIINFNTLTNNKYSIIKEEDKYKYIICFNKLSNSLFYSKYDSYNGNDNPGKENLNYSLIKSYNFTKDEYKGEYRNILIRNSVCVFIRVLRFANNFIKDYIEWYKTKKNRKEYIKSKAKVFQSNIFTNNTVSNYDKVLLWQTKILLGPDKYWTPVSESKMIYLIYNDFPKFIYGSDDYWDNVLTKYLNLVESKITNDYINSILLKEDVNDWYINFTIALGALYCSCLDTCKTKNINKCLLLMNFVGGGAFVTENLNTYLKQLSVDIYNIIVGHIRHILFALYINILQLIIINYDDINLTIYFADGQLFLGEDINTVLIYFGLDKKTEYILNIDNEDKSTFEQVLLYFNNELNIKKINLLDIKNKDENTNHKLNILFTLSNDKTVNFIYSIDDYTGVSTDLPHNDDYLTFLTVAGSDRGPGNGYYKFNSAFVASEENILRRVADPFHPIIMRRKDTDNSVNIHNINSLQKINDSISIPANYKDIFESFFKDLDIEAIDEEKIQLFQTQITKVEEKVTNWDNSIYNIIYDKICGIRWQIVISQEIDDYNGRLFINNLISEVFDDNVLKITNDSLLNKLELIN